MQKFYGRHFLAALGGFDAVSDQDQPAIDAHKMWEQLEHSLRPQGRKPIMLDAAAVKVIEQLGVEAGPQIQGSCADARIPGATTGLHSTTSPIAIVAVPDPAWSVSMVQLGRVTP